MIYLWVEPEYHSDKDVGLYKRKISAPHYLLLRHGEKISKEEFGRCYLYVRSSVSTDPNDLFLRRQLRHEYHAAYLFTETEMFIYDNSMIRKVNIDKENLKTLKKELGIVNSDMDQPPKLLSDEQLQSIAKRGLHTFSRVPVVDFECRKARLAKFDCLVNTGSAPLVNNKVKDILIEIAPNDVQFFKAKVMCIDGELEGYYYLNATHQIMGVDREKSVCKLQANSDYYLEDIKYLTYKPGCMGTHKLARSAEYLGHLLVTKEIKEAFEKEHIKGVRIISPEDYYRGLYPLDTPEKVAGFASSLAGIYEAIGEHEEAEAVISEAYEIIKEMEEE